MKKEKSAIVKFYLAFVFILAALAAAIFIYAPGIVKIPICDVEENESEIVVEELEDGSKLVRNVKEGISVVAPEGWGVSKNSVDDLKLKIYKYGENQVEDTDFYDGVQFKVYIQSNSDNLSITSYALQKWGYKKTELLNEKIDEMQLVRTIKKVIIDEDYDGDYIYENSSESNDLSFAFSNKIYILSCESVGDNYLKFIEECKLLQNDFINNFIDDNEK